jgi:UDP-glucose 4-epimerase
MLSGVRLGVRRASPYTGRVRVLVTGGAGYIGAHTVAALRARGDGVVILDDLSSGDRNRVGDVPLISRDLSTVDPSTLAADLRAADVETVIHFAAKKQVGESVERPAWYFRQNVGGLASLLLAMREASVGRLVFSSSASVYGNVDGRVRETAAVAPINPYGASKAVGEQLVEAEVIAGWLTAASLRYFNVGGASEPALADAGAVNLIPQVLQRLDVGRPPLIFGDDYDTPDGTCVRDYVHVVDVAEAHLAVLDSLRRVRPYREFNVGTGVGTSVFEMITALERAWGSGEPPEVVERRSGDPAVVVADVDSIEAETGWRARFGLDDIVASAVAAWRGRGDDAP